MTVCTPYRNAPSAARRHSGAREARAARGRGAVPAGHARAAGRRLPAGLHARLLGRRPRRAPRLPHAAHEAQEAQVWQVRRARGTSHAFRFEACS